MNYLWTLLILCCSSWSLWAQPLVTVIGYVYESNNRGYLNGVEVTLQAAGQEAKYRAVTNLQGKFELQLPITDNPYLVTAKKTAFQPATIQLSTKGKRRDEGVFAKIEMSRLPGYQFEMSITELVDESDPGAPAYGVEGVKIEVYNNTLQKEIHNAVNTSKHTISFYLEQGTEYIFLLRKEGYYTKRMRANVNVNGCLLCMEGFGSVKPGVTQNLTRENTMGTLQANVPMRKLVLNERMKLENIYYDLGRATLRPEAHEGLNRLIELLYDNPQIIVEISAHTDSRGNNAANLVLSQKRANSVVQYIKQRVKLQPNQIVAKGYGELRPVNVCVDGVECSEESHQANRRTELTVIDIKAEDPSQVRSLASMMQERNFDLILEANMSSYVSGDQTPVERPHRQQASKPQSITTDYSGYKIQLLEEKGQLSTNQFIFYEFDKVTVDLIGTEHYIFLVGDYPTKQEAQQALQRLKKTYPKAAIVYYEGGLRQL
jgi:outer membrane protein OmpA-like peptidoglycan-associated protein